MQSVPAGFWPGCFFEPGRRCEGKVCLGCKETVDSVLIEGLECQACVGVPDEERRVPQKVLIDLELSFDLRWAGTSDRFEETVDYAAVTAEVKKLAEGRSFHLVEALAEAVAELVLNRFHVRRVRVRIRKFSLPGASSVGVEVVRGETE